MASWFRSAKAKQNVIELFRADQSGMRMGEVIANAMEDILNGTDVVN